MATEEAREMLDALMGGDRNAPLPPGAALPRSKKRRNKHTGELQLQLPGKRSKSCYDKDIDPLYNAWGIDVYELFVNTKSDIGPNPYVVDKGARAEFLSLPPHEKERLGFDYFLFHKLQELVRTGDRTVQRNKEKLAQEMRRLVAKRGGQADYVQDVDDSAIETLARHQIELEDLQKQLDDDLNPRLDSIQDKEDGLTLQLLPILEKKRENEQSEDATAEKGEPDDPSELSSADKAADTQEAVAVKVEQAQTEPPATSGDVEATDAVMPKVEDAEKSTQGQSTQMLQTELGKLTLEKQRLLWEAARTMSQISHLQESMEGQLRNLHYVKSDIAADKTVCEVSGNYMSSRDADERIAAHYAGKQYVGWKLVRDKLKEMTEKYGRYGPPPPGRPQQEEKMVLGRRDSGSGPFPARGGGGYNGGSHNRGGYDRGGGRDSGRDRGRDRFDGGRDRGRRGNDRGMGFGPRHGGPPSGQYDHGRRGGGGGRSFRR